MAVAIVSVAARCAGAATADEYWSLLRSGIPQFAETPVDRWTSPAVPSLRVGSGNRSYSNVMAALNDPYAFDGRRFKIPASRVRRMDPQQRIAVTLADELFERAASDVDRIKGSRVATIIGVSSTDYRVISTSPVVSRLLVDGSLGNRSASGMKMVQEAERATVEPVSGHTMPGVLGNMVPSVVQSVFDLTGPAYALDAACASGLVALDTACDLLELGRVDACITGGIYVALTPEAHVGFSAIGALSRTGVCAPFYSNADGFVIGEGGALVLLKRLEDALAEGDTIWGVVDGRGTSNDGRAPGVMTPTVRGQVQAIRESLVSSGATSLDVDYVEGHGTGTVVGDRTELESLNAVTQDSERSSIALGSAKAIIGHTMAASGALSMVKALLCLANNQYVPQPDSAQELNPLIKDSALFVPTIGDEMRGVEKIAVNSFGFGGTNCHVSISSIERFSHE